MSTAVFPTMRTEVAFASGATSTAPVWVDISAYVLPGYGGGRGRSSEQAASEVGTRTVRLRNVDGRFDAKNTTSPYNMNGNQLLPMRPIRQTAVFPDGSTSIRFNGFVLGWPQNWTLNGRYGEVTIRCQDALRALAAFKFGARYIDVVLADKPSYFYVPPTSGTAVNLAEAILPAGDTPSAVLGGGAAVASCMIAGSPLASYEVTSSGGNWETSGVTSNPVGNSVVPANGTGTLAWVTTGDYYLEVAYRPVSIPTNSTHADVILAYNQVPGSPPGAPTYWARLRAQFGATAAAATYTLAMNQASAATAMTITPTPPVAGQIDHFIITRVGATTSVYQNGALIGSSTAFTGGNWNGTGGANRLVFCASMTTAAAYKADIGAIVIGQVGLTAAQASNHYNALRTYREFLAATAGTRIGQVLDAIGWPAGSRALDTGTVTLQATGTIQGQTGLALAQSAAADELGDVFATGAGIVTFHDRNHPSTLTTPAFILGDGPGEVPYTSDLTLPFDEQLIINDWTITQANVTPPVVTQVTDAASASDYFPRADTKTLAYTTAADIAATATFLLARTKDPHQRADGLVLDIASNPARLPAYAGLEKGMFVRINRRPPYAPAITVDCIVEKIDETGDVNVLKLTLSLSPKL